MRRLLLCLLLLSGCRTAHLPEPEGRSMSENLSTCAGSQSSPLQSQLAQADDGGPSYARPDPRMGDKTEVAADLGWREIALVETSQAKTSRVDYRVQWPTGGAPALRAALQGQIREWLAGQDDRPPPNDSRSPDEILRKRAEALREMEAEVRDWGTASVPYEDRLVIRPAHAGHGALSLRMEQYSFTGGAHGNPSSSCAVFSLSDGRRQTLDHLLVPDAHGPLTDMIKAGLRAQRGLAPDASLEEAGFWEKKIRPSQKFYLDERGLWFCYDVYEIAPYAAGDFAVCLPYAALQAWARPGGALDTTAGGADP